MLKRILSISLIVIFSFTAFSQKMEKVTEVLSQRAFANPDATHTVWIYLNDKGDNISEKLTLAEQNLHPKSKERRQKSMKSNQLVSFIDIPVEVTYVNQIDVIVEKIRHQSRWLNAISAEATTAQIAQIAQLDFVKSIDIVRKATLEPVDETTAEPIAPTKSTNYNLDYGSSLTQVEMLNVPMVHDMGYTGDGIIICVLDAGFNNLEHDVFSSMDIIDTYDFVNDDPNVDDEGDLGNGGHGTNTLSTIGGFYEGELIGPAYGASYLLAKTENTDSETQVEEDNWVAGAEWGELNGAMLTSTSLGYIDFDDGFAYGPEDMDGNTAVITIAADYMASLGLVVVNSAGNSGSGTTTIGAPADGNEVLAIGAVRSDRTRSSFSSMGPTADGRIKPDLMAMGSSVVVAETSGNGYTTSNGTSFSCPLAAGTAALLWEMVPQASNMDIYEALKMTADNAETPDNAYGWGIIDLYAAYEYLALPQIETIPLADTEDFNGPYEVYAEVTSFFDMITDGVVLHYRVDGGTWQDVIMNNTSGETYLAEIPGIGMAATFDYYITAENINTQVSLPEDAPNNYYTFHALEDTQAPQIVHLALAEYYKVLWPQAQIHAVLEDNSGINLSDTQVEWTWNGMAQTPLNFQISEGNNYMADFSDIEVQYDDVISYHILVVDQANTPNVTRYPSTGEFSFQITDRISFEQNQFSHNWQFSGDFDWIVTDNSAQDGTYSAVSPDLDNSETAALSLAFDTDVSGTISFYKKVSSEDGWDYLKFYINGTLVDEWSGEVSWSYESYPVDAGSYSLKWEYYKDTSVSEGSDLAWIDHIKLPESSLNVTEFNSHNFSIYPNPALQEFFIDVEGLNEIDQVQIFSLTGNLLKNISAYKVNGPISTVGLTSGIYLLKMNNGQDTVVRKIMIK